MAIMTTMVATQAMVVLVMFKMKKTLMMVSVKGVVSQQNDGDLTCTLLLMPPPQAASVHKTTMKQNDFGGLEKQLEEKSFIALESCVWMLCVDE